MRTRLPAKDRDRLDEKKQSFAQKTQIIGQVCSMCGSTGLVYLAENRQTKELFAIKAIQKKKVKDYTTFINEINILRLLVSKLHCRNIS